MEVTGPREPGPETMLSEQKEPPALQTIPEVEAAFAIQAGRELRVIANAHRTSDADALRVCRDIARANVQRPGNVNRAAGKPKVAGKRDGRPNKPSGLGNVDRGKVARVQSNRGQKSMGGGQRGGGRAVQRGGGGGRNLHRGGGGGRSFSGGGGRRGGGGGGRGGGRRR